jgi:hypothetical protein
VQIGQPPQCGHQGNLTRKVLATPIQNSSVGRFAFKQLGQYHGAKALTGFGLRFRHLAQRSRLPFTAVFGRTFFPVLRMIFPIGASSHYIIAVVGSSKPPVFEVLLVHDAPLFCIK